MISYFNKMNDTDSPNDYFGEVEKRSTTFKVVMSVLALFSLLPLYSAIKGLEGKFLEGENPSTFYVLIALIIISLLSVWGMYRFKKIAVFTFVASAIAQYLWYLLAYGVDFFDMIFVFFLFIGFGLLEIIPRWKYFK